MNDQVSTYSSDKNSEKLFVSVVVPAMNEEGNIQIDMIITDSEALTAPWPVTHQFRRLPPGTMVYDYGCAENNRNPVDTETGETLTLDQSGNPFPLD